MDLISKAGQYVNRLMSSLVYNNTSVVYDAKPCSYDIDGIHNGSVNVLPSSYGCLISPVV